MGALSLSRWTLALRTWQHEACETWWQKRPDDALIVACPGAGKTRFAMRLAHALLEAGEISQLVVVVPKEHLKGQVARSMAGAGICLDAEFANATGSLASDLHGAVVTYQQVAFAPLVFRRLVRSKVTLVILDEIHHAGDDATWGKAMRDAFESARYRVAMSGTPFRSDGSAIPFVSYDRGLCLPDYAYDYGKALADGVCRPLVFSLHGAVAEWVSRDGIAIEASFETALENRTQESERLRTALTQDGWMGEVIGIAHDRLQELRQMSQSDAAGLIVAMNQEHARYIARLLKAISGYEPVVVVSEDDSASRNIRNFANSRQPWIVAVHMISEGVDIPRLRVGVYATNVGTPMYFRQFCGRFVRSQKELLGEQHSFVFMPDDPYLRPLAAAIHLDVQGHLKAKRDGQTVDNLALGGRLPPETATDDFYSPIMARATNSGVLHGHPSLFSTTEKTPVVPLSPFSQDRLVEAASAADLGTTKLTARSTRDRRRLGKAPEIADLPVTGNDPLAARRALRREINTLVSNVRVQFGVDHKKIHGTLNQRFGGSLATATQVDLEKRRSALLNWLQKRTYDGFS